MRFETAPPAKTGGDFPVLLFHNSRMVHSCSLGHAQHIDPAAQAIEAQGGCRAGEVGMQHLATGGVHQRSGALGIGGEL